MLPLSRVQLPLAMSQFMASIAYLLFDLNFVDDGFYPRNTTGNRCGLGGFSPGVGGSGQMHHAIGGVDADREGADFLVGDQRRLHFGRDRGVIDVLTSAASCLRTSTTCQTDQQRSHPYPA